MTNYYKGGESPVVKALNKTREEINTLMTQQTNAGLKDSIKTFVAMFAPPKPLGMTSPKRTYNILQQARIQYFPPQQLDKRLEAVKTAAMIHQDARLTQKTASKKIEEELDVAMLRLQSKQFREETLLKQRIAMEERVKMLDESQIYITDLTNTINRQRIAEDQQKGLQVDHVRQLREEQRAALVKIREEQAQRKMEEKKRIQSISQSNHIKIKQQTDELIAENRRCVKNHHSSSQFSSKGSNTSHNDSLTTTTTQGSGIEEHLDRASKALMKMREKEDLLNENLKSEAFERIRVKKELGLLLPKHYLLSSPTSGTRSLEASMRIPEKSTHKSISS